MKKDKLSAFNSSLMGYLISIGETPVSILEEESKKNEKILGSGYSLRSIELTEEESKSRHISSMKYSHLYHNGLKISDSIFRSGGSCVGFKEGYCELIYYTRISKKKNPEGFSSGDHVIVNHLGEIVLRNEGSYYPYHIGGHIGALRDFLYDLRTGEKIAPYPSGSIKGKNHLIINHQYSFHNKEFPLGVYMINLQTAEVVKIDETRK